MNGNAINNQNCYQPKYLGNNKDNQYIGKILSFRANKNALCEDVCENSSKIKKDVSSQSQTKSEWPLILAVGCAITGIALALKANKDGLLFKGPLAEVKKIQKVFNGEDNTINSFFEVTKRKDPLDGGVIKLNGKKIKLPDLDDPDACLKWWQKNVSKKPLDLNDQKKVVVLKKLPKRVQSKIIASLSRRGIKLTKYDDARLIQYRADLNNRRILINLQDAVPTKKGQAVIDKVSNKLYKKYAKKGLKNEKKLIVMIGQKAAGKSTLVDKMCKTHGVLVADSDEIRHFIGSQETELHGRLKYAIKDNLADMAIKDGTNFLVQFHGTGTGKALDIINKFKKAGYSVEVSNIEVPENKLIDRIFRRRELANKDADPLSVILCGKKDQKSNFYKISRSGKVNRITRYDNDVKYGALPKKISEVRSYRVISGL